MATFTWKDVDDLLASEGLYMDNDERRKLANDPDTAYSIAKKKQLYKYAQTDDERSKIHSDTESLRAGSGYSMGSNGAMFSTVQSPSSFSSVYTGDKNKFYEAARDYGDFTYDAFDDKYVGKRAELLDAIANPTPFEYNKDNDPVYQSFAKQYRREGARAVEEALAKAAANTGGRASTAAVTAAAQAGNYHAAQAADKILQLYDAAYNRWLDEFTMKQNALAAYQGETDADYDRYTSERSFAKGVYDDKYARLIDAMNNAAVLEGVDYDRHIDNITYNDEKKRQELEDAITLGTQVGDTSALKGMGYDTIFLDAKNNANASGAYLENQYLNEQLKQLKSSAVTEAEQNAISKAELRAAMGDYTDLARLLGVSVAQVEAAYAAEGDTPDENTGEELTKKAQSIRAMLVLGGADNIPSVDEISSLLAGGYTGFDDMLIQGTPGYVGDGYEYTSNMKQVEGLIMDKREFLQRGKTAYGKVYNNYDEYVIAAAEEAYAKGQLTADEFASLLIARGLGDKYGK